MCRARRRSYDVDSASAFPATSGAAVMRIEPTERTRSGGSLFVTWAFPTAPSDLPYAEAYPVRSAFALPLLDTSVDIDGSVVSVYATRNCNPYGGTPIRYTIRETRVPAPPRPGRSSS